VNQASFSRPIGSHLGKTIYESIKNEDGQFVFDRIAECDTDGCCPLDQLHKNEMMLRNGLIYKKAS